MTNTNPPTEHSTEYDRKTLLLLHRTLQHCDWILDQNVEEGHYLQNFRGSMTPRILTAAFHQIDALVHDLVNVPPEYLEFMEECSFLLFQVSGQFQALMDDGVTAPEDPLTVAQHIRGVIAKLDAEIYNTKCIRSQQLQELMSQSANGDKPPARREKPIPPPLRVIKEGVLPPGWESRKPGWWWPFSLKRKSP